MTCFSPITAWFGNGRGSTGKRPIQFARAGAFDGVPMDLPCGKCIGCRLERSRVWAIRCVHEAKMHPRSCFVTLTYSDECLPCYGTLVLRDLQLFLKRLRVYFDRAFDLKFRFYACGEYGDVSLRPHYHVLLFGVDFDDKLLYSKSSRGDTIYTSSALDSVWALGSCKIGEVNFETAAYVARYCVKKVDGAKRDAGHYLVHDGDGVVFERVPEFSTMSRAGGIGSSYYEKFGSEIRAHDSIVVNGVEVSSIRYYDLKFEAIDPVGFAAIKRKRAAPLYSPEYFRRLDDKLPLSRFKAHDAIARGKLNLKKRVL